MDMARVRSRCAAAAVLAAGLWLSGGAAFAAGPERAFVLENGLRVFLYEKRDLPLLHVVTGFDVGVKDETDETNGLVHLLEHCILFRGTSAGSEGAIGARMRRHGASFNGRTGPDLAVFEISLPAAFADFALRSHRDILFGFETTQAEIDSEKQVILEELGQMEDDPERSALDLVFQDLFAGHPYGRSVYGRREVVTEATRDALMAFHRAAFVADNCALAAVGDFDAADMERRVREVFGALPRTGFEPPAIPMAEPLDKSVSRSLVRDVREGYLVIAFNAPDYNHADQYALNVLVEALGRGVNPLLAGHLHALRDSVQNVSMSYLARRFGGAAVVSIRARPKDLAIVERAAVRFLRQARDMSYSSGDYAGLEASMAAFDYLAMAKNQIRFATGQAEESGLQLAASLVRHMLLNTRPDPGRYLESIARVDSSDLRKVASRYLGRGEYAAVSVVPPERRGP
ncbi:MAG TPA: insulinase family protein [Candidatus Aminicenantes bacterium]|nr:insulinase family protein [Candidatus Aminicenantes bacterium]HDT13290.1 insulinase family protein [Candidatus Aminicenantes bacterium]